MNIIRLAIERPIAVVSAVLMAVLFGALALTTIPIQLVPDVRKPVIQIETYWPGAAPAEVEREIVNRQEEVMKGLSGLETIVSQASPGRSRVNLEFAVGTNMDRSLLLVANRLDRVNGYPSEVDEPTIDTSGSDDNPITWIIMTRVGGVTTPIHQFGDFAEDVVQERLERVEGVSRVNIYGSSNRQLEIIIRPQDMARYGLTIPYVINRLRSENVSISAGDVEEGKRRYVVRAEGELNEIEAIQKVVLRGANESTDGRISRITIGDIADVRFGYTEPRARIRIRGEPAIAINAVRETGANVIETMAGIRVALDELKEGPIARNGLQLEQVYDETIYINGAIDLVIQNIWVGGLLAATILMIFLRSPRATLVISLAIPVSVIAAFVAMAALGRTLNVISLAGIAFAVGMVVDAAIVVLENIYRLRQEGKPPKQAAFEGASQVWGAIFVSALTTVLVFVPILVMELEAGQLFRDIAVAISVAVILSLIVAVTVVPALANKLLVNDHTKPPAHLPVFDHFAHFFSMAVCKYTNLCNQSRVFGLGMVATISFTAIALCYVFLPKLEYLPEGNRNLVFGVIIPPPGYNLNTMETIAARVENTARPYWEKVHKPESPTAAGPEDPGMKHFFFVAFNGTTFLGARADDPNRVKELIPILSGPIFAEPGTFGFISQRSIFGRGIGGGRSIELNVSGQDLNEILGVSLRAAGRVGQLFPREEGHQFRPRPGLELGAPEVRISPNRIRLADAGVDARTLADTVDVFNDGIRVAEVTVGAERIDLILKGFSGYTGTSRTQEIDSFPVVTQEGLILPVGSLADVDLTAGPTEIRHRDRLRTVTLEIRPSQNVSLEEAIEIIENEVIAPITDEGLPQGIRMSLSGSADDLTQTWNAIQINLLLALIIVFLVMAVLFESFILPLVIMLSVPVAAAGGVAGLAILNLYQTQPLDMLTLLGFVILIGIVVNNAILLVHQTLHHQRVDHMNCNDAIMTATQNRIRPIFMSTLTSVFGMLPLVVIPGAGSELYRGLGSVVVGGLMLSAILTLLIVPPLLRVFLREREVEAKMPEDASAKPVAQPAE